MNRRIRLALRRPQPYRRVLRMVRRVIHRTWEQAASDLIAYGTAIVEVKETGIRAVPRQEWHQ